MSEDYDEVTRLRLRLSHVEAQRDAFEAALRKEVLAVIREAAAQATYDAKQDVESAGLEVKALSDENARLQAEVDRLTALVESNLNSSKIAMGKADAVLRERDTLKAEVERLRQENGEMFKRIKDGSDAYQRLHNEYMVLRDKAKEAGPAF